MKTTKWNDVFVYGGNLFTKDLTPVFDATALSNLLHKKDLYQENLVKKNQAELHSLVTNQPHQIIEVEGSAFWSYYPWDTNPQHFVIETLPRLLLLCEQVASHPNYIFINNNLINAELATAALSPLPSCFLDPRTSDRVFKLDECYVCENININFRRLPPTGIDLLKRFRRKLLEVHTFSQSSEHLSERIYIDRLQLATNNSSQRVCLNHKEVSKILLQNCVRTVATEQMGLYTRLAEFSRCRSLISVSGASLMNIFFCCDKVQEVIHLVHPAFRGLVPWFREFFESVIEIETIDNPIVETDDGSTLTSKEYMNLSFSVNPSELGRLLQ